MPKTPALFLDRDGVIIENRANYVRSWADVEIYPQALAALASIRDTHFKIIIVTNQSAVGRGIISLETAWTINDQLVAAIRAGNGRIDDTFICPHAPEDACDCRKPRPGLLLQAAAKYDLDLGRSIMIGDALSDIEAGINAGLKLAVLLMTGRGLAQIVKPEAAAFSPITVSEDLFSGLKTIKPLLLPDIREK